MRTLEPEDPEVVLTSALEEPRVSLAINTKNCSMGITISASVLREHVLYMPAALLFA